MSSAEDLRQLRRANPAPLERDHACIDRARQWADFDSIIASRPAAGTRAGSARNRRRLVVATVVALALIAVSAPLAVAVKTEMLSILVFSNRGEPAALTPEQNAAIRMRNRHLNGEWPEVKWRFLGEAGNVWFYTGDAEDGGRCIALFLAPNDRSPGVLGCGRPNSGGGSGFPLGRGPVLDFSAFRSEQGSGTLLTRMVGFAGDGVDRVGVVRADGEVVWAEVVNNIYGLREVPPGPVTAIIAVDETGRRVFTQDLR